jgi:YD repeat-containing protein
VRRHVSAVTYDGPLGKNWEFTYNARVDEDSGTGDVTLWDGTGREDVFTESSGTYATPAGRFETLTRSGPPAKLHLVKPNGTDYLFDATTGRLESITDRFGNAMSFSYDGSDRLGTVTDTLGRDVTFAYDANDRIGTITDFDGRVWTYGYNGSGELVTVTTPGVTGFTSGKVTTYAYADGRLDTITDGRSQLVVDVTYTSGKATTVRYGDSGDDVDFDHDTPSAGKVTITDRNGNLTVVTVDANNQVSEVLEKTNRDIRSGEGDYTTSYTFNADLLLTGITFPAGNKAVYSYEASGSDNLTEEKFTNGAGTVEIWSTWTYTSLFSLVESYEELRGTTATGDEFVRTYLYDFDEATAGDLNGDGVTAGDDGALVKIAFPTVTSQSPSITPAETFRSNAHGQVTRWDRPDGEVTTFTHYSSGAQEGYLQKRVDDDTTGGLLLTTQWTYDDVGNVASVTDRNGWTTTYTVNALNQVEQETIPIASGVDFDVKYEYDGNDNLSKKEVENLDETGTAYSNAWITTSFTHETLNRVATRVDEVDASTTVTTTYTYDGNRNRTHVQRPEGNVVRTEWDERDLVHRITRGSGSTTAIPAQEERTWTGNRLLATRS